MLLIELHSLLVFIIKLLVDLVLNLLHSQTHHAVIVLSSLQFVFELEVGLQKVLVPSCQFLYLFVVLY